MHVTVPIRLRIGDPGGAYGNAPGDCFPTAGRSTNVAVGERTGGVRYDAIGIGSWHVDGGLPMERRRWVRWRDREWPRSIRRSGTATAQEVRPTIIHATRGYGGRRERGQLPVIARAAPVAIADTELDEHRRDLPAVERNRKGSRGPFRNAVLPAVSRREVDRGDEPRPHEGSATSVGGAAGAWSGMREVHEEAQTRRGRRAGRQPPLGALVLSVGGFGRRHLGSEPARSRPDRSQRQPSREYNLGGASNRNQSSRRKRAAPSHSCSRT